MADPNAARLLGTWKLISAVREEKPSGTKTDLFGSQPIGFLNYSADGRMLTLIVRGDRKRPAGYPISPEDAAGLFRSLVSYAGTWEVRAMRYSIMSTHRQTRSGPAPNSSASMRSTGAICRSRHR